MADFPLQPYDVLILVILAAWTFFGLWKGLAWQVASVASFVVSYLVAVQGSGYVAPLLSVREPWNHLVAMLILFVATSAAVWLAFRLVAGVIDRIQLKAFDRQLGALLGFGKGVLICLVVTFFAVTLSETLRQQVLRSRSGYYMALLIDRINPVLPAEVRGLIGEYLEELNRKLQPSPVGGGREETPSEGGLRQAVSASVQSALGQGQGLGQAQGANSGLDAASQAGAGLSEFFSRQAPIVDSSAKSAGARESDPGSGQSQPRQPQPQGGEVWGQLVPIP